MDNSAKLKQMIEDDSPERAIQSFYRQVLDNHLRLSDLADSKANTLLYINAILISLFAASLFSKFDVESNKYLIIPSLVLLTFSLIVIYLSVLVTNPKVSSGRFTKEDIESNNVNLMFFGNFYKMDLDVYEDAVKKSLKSKEKIYGMLTKDLYFQGVVLDKKYRLLKTTYTVFICGLLISCGFYAVAYSLTQVG